MTDSFTTAWEECQRAARAEALAAHRVVSLRPDLPASERASIALNALQQSIETLEMLADELPARAFEHLRDAERSISFLAHRAKLARSLAHLTSVFGRAP